MTQIWFYSSVHKCWMLLYSSSKYSSLKEWQAEHKNFGRCAAVVKRVDK